MYATENTINIYSDWKNDFESILDEIIQRFQRALMLNILSCWFIHLIWVLPVGFCLATLLLIWNKEIKLFFVCAHGILVR